MSEKCHRTGKAVYAADSPVRIYGLVFSKENFKCAATGVKLTMKNCVFTKSEEFPDGEVYLSGKEPKAKPTQVASSVADEHAKNVQKHEAKSFVVAADNKFIGSATDSTTEHVKGVQTHEAKKFVIAGDEKFVGGTSLTESHVNSVQTHEAKKFAAGEREAGAGEPAAEPAAAEAE